MVLLFDCFPVVKGLLVPELRILWKEYNGGAHEGYQCSRILSDVDSVEPHVRQLEFEQESAHISALESSQISPDQLGARLNAGPILHCLRRLHGVGKSIFELVVIRRYVA